MAVSVSWKRELPVYRCQDRATLKLKESAGGDAKPVQLNFFEDDYIEDEALVQLCI